MTSKGNVVAALSPVSLLLAGSLTADAGILFSNSEQPIIQYQTEVQAPLRIASREERIVGNLKLLGYARIKVNYGPHGTEMVVACKDGRRTLLKVSSTYGMRTVSQLGKCLSDRLNDIATGSIKRRAAKTPEQKIQGMLAMSGYKLIKLNRRGGIFTTADVCHSDKLMRVELSKDAKVTRVNRVGTCANRPSSSLFTAAISDTHIAQPTPLRALKPIRNYLRSKGYNRLSFTDRTPPYYKVTACLDEKKMRINMRDSGSIIKVSRIGTCSSFAPLPQVDEMVTAAIPSKTNAVAHYSITSKAKIRSALMMSGYKNIKIKSISGKLVSAKACHNEKLMRLDLDGAGKVIRVNRVGDCRKQRFGILTTASINRPAALSQSAKISGMLAMSGYKVMKLNRQAGQIKTAEVCRSCKLMSLDLDQNGKVTRISRIGSCAKGNADNIITAAIPGKPALRPTPLRALKPLRAYLRTKGFNRMVFTDRTPPYYKVTACLDEKQMQIDMRDSGFVTKVSRIGTCSNFAPMPEVDNMVTAAIPATAEPVLKHLGVAKRKIRSALMMSGYKHIKIKAAGDKLMSANACHNEKLMRLDLDEKGKVTRVNRIGDCQTPAKLTTASLVRPSAIHGMLAMSGYKVVKLSRKSGVIASADVCHQDKLMRVEISKDGKVTRRSRIGDCGAPGFATAAINGRKASLSQPEKVRGMLAMSGYKVVGFGRSFGTIVTADVCRSGKLMRLDIGEGAKVVRRSRVGNCGMPHYANITTAAIKGTTALRPTSKQALKPLRDYLRSKGYNRISFKDRTAPLYRATACLNERYMRIDMRDSGFITKVSRIGTCSNFAPLPATPTEGEQVAQAHEYVPANNLMREGTGFSNVMKLFESPNTSFGPVRTAHAGNVMSDALPQSATLPTQLVYTCGSTFKDALKSERIKFNPASTEVAPSSQAQLDRIAVMLTNCNGNKVIVGGYTDSDGSKARNRALGEKRAKAVISYLTKRGVKRSQLAPIGYGEADPLVPNTSRANKAKNRRVEFLTF